MVLIRNVVHQALRMGCLTVEAEYQLKQLLTKKYELEDLDAFMTLQQAMLCGCVEQESHNSRKCVECCINGIDVPTKL
jgi:hypothetical protein